MKFGHFDNDAKEYVIDRPDTPQSWSNYLVPRNTGAVITNNAEDTDVYQSGARGRFMRLRFNAVPMDQPGALLLSKGPRERRYLVGFMAAGGKNRSAGISPAAGMNGVYHHHLTLCRHRDRNHLLCPARAKL